MLKSLAIQNFKNFQKLEIDPLARVNLFTGRNNVGKTSLLEAISVLVTKGDFEWVYDILEEREEFSLRGDTSKHRIEDADRYLNAYGSLFYQRKIDFNKSILLESSGSYRIEIRFVYFIKKRIKELDSEKKIIEYDKKEIVSTSDIQRLNIDKDSIFIGIELKAGENSTIYSIDWINQKDTFNKYLKLIKGEQELNVQFLKVNLSNPSFFTISELWDKVALTEREDYIISALQIIEPRIERVSFIQQHLLPIGERKAVVKLKGEKNPYPLKSMGDGINRILSIILHAVNAENGYLLIDEFENGLHFSVQEQLWKIIFKLAEELNIQVFATTHSNDCINAFSSYLSSTQQADGKLFRLDKTDSEIRAVEFSEKELKIASEQGIDLRL
jgi:AAA15 family ATPase/GTPase